MLNQTVQRSNFYRGSYPSACKITRDYNHTKHTASSFSFFSCDVKKPIWIRWEKKKIQAAISRASSHVPLEFTPHVTLEFTRIRSKWKFIQGFYCCNATEIRPHVLLVRNSQLWCSCSLLKSQYHLSTVPTKINLDHHQAGKYTHSWKLIF